jgi:NAD(P)H-dependent FMN reductase
MANPKIAIIVSSIRPTRFADVPTAWIKAQAQAHGGLDVEVVDLRDYPMPFFAEVASNA